MSAQDIWLRSIMNYGRNSKTTQKVHFALLCGSGWYQRQNMPCKLLHVLQKVLSTSTCMQAWCDKKGLDTAIHPIPKCVIFLEDLLQEMVEKKSKDPFGTIRVARKALSKVRYFSCCCNDMEAAIAA